MSPRCARRTVLVLLLVLAAATRFWGLGWGLPNTYHIDENRFAQISVEFLRGDLNPHFFHVGTLHMYLLAGMWKAYQWVGGFDSTETMITALVKDPTPFYLIGRGLSAVLGVATVLLIYLIGLRMFGFRVGAAAGLFMAFSLEHIKISHAMLPDGPTLFLLVLTFYLAWRIYQTGRTRYYLLAGLTAGAAMAMKYAGHMMAIPIFVAHVARILENGLPKKKIILDWRLYLCGFVFLATFVAGCPYAVLDFPRFLNDFRWQANHLMVQGHSGSSIKEPAWLFYFQYGFRDNLGLWVQYFAFFGTGLAFVRRRGKDWILLSYPIIQFAMICLWKAYATRYLLPMAPFFALLAGLGAEQAGIWAAALWGRIRSRKTLPLLPAGVFVLLVSLVAAAPSAVKAARYDHSIAGEDTRTTARDWVHWNIPAGEKVAIEEYDPPISRERYATFYRHSLSDVDVDHLVRQGIRFVIINDIDYARYTDYAAEFPGRAVFYADLDSSATLIKTFRPAYDEDLIDLHNPTIKIYRLPATPDVRFPGHFERFAADVDLEKTAGGTWKIRAEASGRLGPDTGEPVADLYLSLRDPRGRELVRLDLLRGLLPGGDFRAGADGETGSLPEASEIVLGYAYVLSPNPLRVPPEHPFGHATAFADKADAAVLDSGRWSAHYRYAGETDAAAGHLFWPVSLSLRGGTATLRGS
ncbi:MAG: glycosyltransferase family 39 protein, partial [Acidobacteriota bacterium]|nr:glycosyltransferase family 39 protein [Acidobacteriota bacterium]